MALNGQFPSTMLAYLGWPEADHLQLVPGAAASLTRLAAKFEAAFGTPLYITDAYRTLAVQKALKISKGPFAATPGTSNHGLGLAIDMASRINVDGSAEHLWMSVHGPEFGWINPYWAVDFNPLNGQHEPWHWEWDYRLDRSTFAQAAPAVVPAPAALAPIIPTTPEDTMLIIESPGALSLLIGGKIVGLGTTEQAARLEVKGAERVVWDAAEFKRLREALAGFDLIQGGGSYAVGRPGSQYRGLGDMGEVNYLRAQGCRERAVSPETMRNLTA